VRARGLFEKVETNMTATEVIPVPAKYHSVNSRWPAGTNDGMDLKPEPEEAMRAARRLYRFVFKRPFRGKMKLTSGNRRTYIRQGVFYVNPDCHCGGWHEIVHDISHYASVRLFPNAPGHGHQHAFIERELVKYVVENGFLDGKLKRPARAAPTPSDRRQARVDRLDERIARWDSKLRRAQNALRKLSRQRRRMV
jgi:hypothetical protein